LAVIKKRFMARGATCRNCEHIIKREARKEEGVISIDYDFSTERGTVLFDDSKTSLTDVFGRIEAKGYSCSEDQGSRWQGGLFALIGIIVLGYFILRFSDSIPIPAIDPRMSYLLLFLVGLLTGFHCIAMCGGFVVSYVTGDRKAGRSSNMSHILYGAGKLVSYTLIGAAFGLLGSFIAFTPVVRGIVGMAAGLFLIVFGLSMLIPFLRRFSIPIPKVLSKVMHSNSRRGPLVIGLLNGLMIACGPLQAIYVMAAGTGSLVEGAKLLFIFGLGTLPVMLGFGYFASFASLKWSNYLTKASGVIVVLLGILMLNYGLTLTGAGYDLKSLAAADPLPEAPVPTMTSGFQEIRMDVTSKGWEPNSFVLQKGVRVKWIINGKQITSCNKAIQVPKLGLEFDIKPGEQVIEFTPTEEGKIPFSCWMGMIPGQFIVRDSVSAADKAEAESPLPSGGTCDGSATGSCGCGMRNFA
jgi:uncharacterized protein